MTCWQTIARQNSLMSLHLRFKKKEFSERNPINLAPFSSALQTSDIIQWGGKEEQLHSTFCLPHSPLLFELRAFYLCLSLKQTLLVASSLREKAEMLLHSGFQSYHSPKGVLPECQCQWFERNSENTDACLLSPFLWCLCWREIGTGASSLQHSK